MYQRSSNYRRETAGRASEALWRQKWSSHYAVLRNSFVIRYLQ